MRKQEGSTTIVFGSVNGVTKTTKATTNWTGTEHTDMDVNTLALISRDA